MVEAVIASLKPTTTLLAGGTPWLPPGGSSPTIRGAVVSGPVLLSYTTSTQ